MKKLKRCYSIQYETFGGSQFNMKSGCNEKDSAIAWFRAKFPQHVIISVFIPVRKINRFTQAAL